MINFNLLDHLQAKMLSKRKSGSKSSSQELRREEEVVVRVSRISMTEYQQHYCDKDVLQLLAKPFGEIKVDSYADLEHVRHQVILASHWLMQTTLNSDWLMQIDTYI